MHQNNNGTDGIGDHLNETLRQVLPFVLQFCERLTDSMFITGDWIINDVPCDRLHSLEVGLVRLFLTIKTFNITTR